MASCTPNDTTPPPIDSSASQLRQTRSALDAPHTSYSHSVTINDLPCEILVHIFMLAKVYCKHEALAEYQEAKWHIEDGRRDQPLPSFYPENVSDVCVYWRKLSDNTPALWSHIDLSIDRAQDANFAFHAQRSLERAKQLPLYVHVEDVDKHSDARTVVALLAPYANQIVSFELVVNIFTAQSILLGLFSAQYHGSVQSLCLCDPESQQLHSDASLFSTGQLDVFLASLQSLSMRGPALDFSSPAFRDLTELAIIYCIMMPTPYQLMQILAGCPALRSLTLLMLLLAPGNLPSSPANLSNLQSLDLRYTHFDDVVKIVSCILPRQGLSMSFSLNKYRVRGGFSPLSPFFERFRVARLFVGTEGEHRKLDLTRVLHSLGDSFLSVEELALDADVLAQSPVEGCLSMDRFPRLHTLHILGHTILVDALQSMLVSSSVQTVRFRWYQRYPSEVLRAISEVVPFVFYSPHTISQQFEPFTWDLPSTSYSKNGVP
ncbi:hypothetical protein BDV93DRAFT_606903 [Ceratobasidium sp. AG-I]|nr:hypothetical protein BDV93DRAFT_606903 [Ceratobasidium sp. AG-I]